MMGSQSKPKAWGERFSLDDIPGTRLLAAALYHANTLSGLQGAAGYWHSILGALAASPDEIEAGKTAVIGDFIFRPEDLWKHKTLAMFVVDRRHEYFPELDRFTPICRNRDIRPQLEALALICDQYFSWHMAPDNAKPALNDDYPRTAEYCHWRNYLAPVCEPPPPPSRPKGSGYRDAAHDAATYAWSLLHTADREGRTLTKSEALRQALACFTVRAPTASELLQHPMADELEDVIFAISHDQGQKRVRKLLEEKIERESPSAMPPPITPWDY